MQSVLDLRLQHWRTPSASTLVSRFSLKDQSNAGSHQTADSGKVAIDGANPAGSSADNGLHTNSDASTVMPPSSRTHLIDREHSGHIQLDGVEVFVDVERGGAENHRIAGSCAVEKIQSDSTVTCPRVDIRTLSDGEEVIFEVRNLRGDYSFVLVGDDEREYGVSLQWHCGP